MQKHFAVSDDYKDDVLNIVYTCVMTKRLQSIGNSSGIIVDKAILDLLKITAETDLELTTDGKSLIITPQFLTADRRRQFEVAKARVIKDHSELFRKLAE